MLTGAALGTGGAGGGVSTERKSGSGLLAGTPTGPTPTPRRPVPSGQRVWPVQWKGDPRATWGFCQGRAHPSSSLGLGPSEGKPGKVGGFQAEGWVVAQILRNQKENKVRVFVGFSEHTPEREGSAHRALV